MCSGHTDKKSETDVQFIAHRREKDDDIQDLWVHLEEVSSIAGKFASKIGLGKVGELAGLLHDLGKASLEFNQYIRSAIGLIDPDKDDYVDAIEKKGKIDHSSAGAQVIHHHFFEKGNENIWTSQILSLIIASHHSGLIDCLSPDGEDNFCRRMNKSEEKTRMKESMLNLNDNIKQQIKSLLSDIYLDNNLKQKLKSLQESNDSNESYMFKIGLLIRFLFSCLIDADRLNTADFEFPELAKQRNNGNYVSWPVLIKKLDLYLKKIEKKNNVDALRQQISNHCLEFSVRKKGLYQLTVPTGGGKTLSSLRFALHHANKHCMDRIIYVIPYTSIIDQNAEKAREVFEDTTDHESYFNHIVLEHHSNLTPEEENTRQKLLSENWDAPVVFTTMVQFLEALFGYGTRSARRMHQLANAVIIFDEIQILPVRSVHLFNVAIRFLVQGCCSTVVLCTATQPLLDRVEPAQRALQITPEQQMMPDILKLFKELKRVEVYDRRKIGGWTDHEVAELVEQELYETDSVLVVANTKKAAISLYQKLQAHPKTDMFHLSTNMCPAHRMKVLDKIRNSLRDKKPIICVSTQLIEAGVDIDFGTVIRYLAGLDSIAQAAGRCNRNGVRPQQGRVFIINPKEENMDKLRDIKIGRDKAERVLEEFMADPKQFDEDILSPKTMERYYHYYFYERREEMCYKVSNKGMGIGRSDNLFELLSTNRLSVEAYQRINNHSSPQIPIRQSFMAASKAFQAIDSPTRGVIVPYGEEGNRIIYDLCATENLEKQYRLLKKAQRYSVNVFPYLFDKLLHQRVIHEVQEDAGVFYVDKQYYSDEYGISEYTVNEMESLIR